MEVHIDESGDLGFSPKSTKFFVVGYVIPGSPWIVKNHLRRLLRKLHRKSKYTGWEFKFSESNHDVRIRVLQELCKLQWDAGVVVLEKDKVKQDLRNNLNILYNYTIVHNVVSDVLQRWDGVEHLAFYIDKSLSASNREGFNEYLRAKADWRWNINLNKDTPLHPERIEVLHQPSHENYCIQLADYVAGTVFQKYERKNSEYYDIIKDKIKSHKYLW